MMRSLYIHQQPEWPRFRWRHEDLLDCLAETRYRQGQLAGRMKDLGFVFRQEVMLDTATEDVTASSEIEGERLDMKQVRSSVARRLGMDTGGLTWADRHVEGIVELTLDATQNHSLPLTRERLCAWHASLFPTGRSGMARIRVGEWRADESGPMQVVSGPIGRQRVHFEAPAAACLDEEMQKFLNWLNSPDDTDGVMKATLAHLWFITIHPFDDGNGRLARAITDMILARSENSTQRFYSMSSQIRKERTDYYNILERIQKGSMDVTEWMRWFLACLGRAVENAETVVEKTLIKARFLEQISQISLNDRQRGMLNRLLNGFRGKVTTSRWSKITKCSHDTALRDINTLISHGILVRNPEGGRTTSYRLNSGLLNGLTHSQVSRSATGQE